MKNKSEALLPDRYYHVYNRAHGEERLFKKHQNYHYFLKKYRQHIPPVAHTLAYCLMPNHFHFLIRIKEESVVFNVMKEQKNKALRKAMHHYIRDKEEKEITLQGFESLEGSVRDSLIARFISQQFSHLFNGYTQAFNRQNQRQGGLFMSSFKRKRIQTEQYLRKLVRYIHFNPVRANLCEKLKDWEFSSYRSILSDKPTVIQRDEVINWFDDRANFKYWHKIEPDMEDLF